MIYKPVLTLIQRCVPSTMRGTREFSAYSYYNSSKFAYLMVIIRSISLGPLGSDPSYSFQMLWNFKGDTEFQHHDLMPRLHIPILELSNCYGTLVFLSSFRTHAAIPWKARR